MGQQSSKSSSPPSQLDPLPLAVDGLSPLANVELQLCMQGLAPIDLLRFARCSRRLMQLADSSFAWKRVMLRMRLAPPESAHYSQRFAAAAPPPPPPLPRSRLLRHARLRVKLALGYPADSTITDEPLQQLLALAAVTRLVEVDASSITRVSLEQWRMMLFDEHVAANLETLHINSREADRHVDSNLARLLVKLPRLHTLKAGSCPSPGDAVLWTALVAAPMLSTVSIIDSFAGSKGSRLPLIAMLPHLTDLRVVRPALYGPAFLAFCSAPLIAQRLQRLTLNFFFAAGRAEGPVENRCAAVSASDYGQAFASMKQLHALTLVGVRRVDAMLPHLSRSFSLRCLTIQPARGYSLSLHDFPAILCRLLTDSPDLHAELLFRAEHPHEDASEWARKELEHVEAAAELKPFIASEQLTASA